MSMSKYLIMEISLLRGCCWSAHLLDFLSIRSHILHLFRPICKLHAEENGLVLLKHTAEQSPAWPTQTLPKGHTGTETNPVISPPYCTIFLAVCVYKAHL